jgi:hypothetical protein
LVEAICDRRMLLVLDNCEHVLDGAAELVDALPRRSAVDDRRLWRAVEIAWRYGGTGIVFDAPLRAGQGPQILSMSSDEIEHHQGRRGPEAGGLRCVTGQVLAVGQDGGSAGGGSVGATTAPIARNSESLAFGKLPWASNACGR